MTLHLPILARSDSFSELWPRLAATAAAELRVVESVHELGDLRDAVAVLLCAGGVEDSVMLDLAQLRAWGAPPVCVIGVATEYRLVAALLQAGADEYCALPADVGRLRSWVLAQVDRIRTADRVQALAAEQRRRFDFSRLVGESSCLIAQLERATKVIPRGAASVLITGETGTGKELLARAIHYNGARAPQPFVEVNCAALPEHLLESELFGYEPGAFTDAKIAKPGLLEIASGGTLFLDEVGDMPPALQAKLLRALDEKRIRRLGSTRAVEVDARIVAATNVDLEAAVAERRFREDLYYRLSVFPIHLPPLRERGDDVIVLAQHFLEHYAREYGYAGLSVTPEVRRALLAHAWPGNVRELRNCIERAVILGEGRIAAEDLFVRPMSRPVGDHQIPFPATLREIDQAAARRMLNHCGGNKTRAAEALGISRKYLYELLGRGEQNADGE